MKILVVSQHFYPETFRINDICFSLAERGHDVTVLTGLPNYPEGRVFDGYRHGENRDQVVNGVRIIRCHLVGRGRNIIGFGINYAWFAISGILKARKIKDDFDLVYSYETSPVSMVYPAITVKKKKNIPLIVNCLDQWPISVTAGPIPEKSLFYRFLYNMSVSIYSKADLITITSESFRSYFENVLKLPAEKYGLVYWPQYAEDTYQAIGRKDNGVYDLLFAGNIGPASNVEMIVETAKLLQDDKMIFFHIVGDGMNRPQCEQLAASYGLDNIRFYGSHPVDEMPPYYELADALMITMVDNPVINYTLPGKMQSYLASGKPIAGSINGETQRVIKEAGCGICVPAEDAAGFAAAIRELASDPDDRLQRGANGRTYYQAHFDKNRLLDQLEDIFAKTIAEKGNRT
ncbi:MAG: glycosyltransferase family 4 protein [Solobacterium sp.]|nr:glycosyltransferase family 4 protein [Solobacterium sp.]